VVGRRRHAEAGGEVRDHARDGEPVEPRAQQLGRLRAPSRSVSGGGTTNSSPPQRPAKSVADGSGGRLARQQDSQSREYRYCPTGVLDPWRADFSPDN
jgi:hypothetical protein